LLSVVVVLWFLSCFCFVLFFVFWFVGGGVVWAVWGGGWGWGGVVVVVWGVVGGVWGGVRRLD